MFCFLSQQGTERGALGVFVGSWWVEAMDAAKYPTMHSQPPTTKNYPAKLSVAQRLRNPGYITK